MTEGRPRNALPLTAIAVLVASCQHKAPEPAASAVAASAPVLAIKAGTGEDAGLIFERQQLMTQLDSDTKILGRIVSGAAPASDLAETTRAIAQGARESVEAFRATIPGGRSKAEVWSNHADFIQRMEAFAANAGKMAKLGETGNVTAVSEVMVDALPCKQCHDVYRAPKR